MESDIGIGSLVEFSFESTLSRGIGAGGLALLVRQAWRNNIEAGVTGEIAVAGRRLSQVIEGEVDAVLPLASRILSDRRHGRIRVLSFRPIAARRHATWRVYGMAAAPTVPQGEIGAGEGKVVALRPAALADQGGIAAQRRFGAAGR